MKKGAIVFVIIIALIFIFSLLMTTKPREVKITAVLLDTTDPVGEGRYASFENAAIINCVEKLMDNTNNQIIDFGETILYYPLNCDTYLVPAASNSLIKLPDTNDDFSRNENQKASKLLEDIKKIIRHPKTCNKSYIIEKIKQISEDKNFQITQRRGFFKVKNKKTDYYYF